MADPEPGAEPVFFAEPVPEPERLVGHYFKVNHDGA